MGFPNISVVMLVFELKLIEIEILANFSTNNPNLKLAKAKVWDYLCYLDLVIYELAN